jgi:hypothetical protein
MEKIIPKKGVFQNLKEFAIPNEKTKNETPIANMKNIITNIK